MILLIPGMLNTAAIWADITDRLVQLGVASSSIAIADVTKDGSISAMALRAWAQVNEARQHKAQPLMLVGFSMGGYVMLDMLAKPQGPVQAAAFVGTTAGPEPADNLPNRERAMAMMEKDFAATVHGIATWGMVNPSEALLEKAKRAMMPVGATAGIAQVKAIVARADQRETARGLKIPVEIIYGEGDRIVNPKGSAELQELITHANVTSILQCGHMVPLEQPDTLAQCIARCWVHLTV
jgi:pimeloyl-ACP methyl ester carboxylesterase